MRYSACEGPAPRHQGDGGRDGGVHDQFREEDGRLPGASARSYRRGGHEAGVGLPHRCCRLAEFSGRSVYFWLFKKAF